MISKYESRPQSTQEFLQGEREMQENISRKAIYPGSQTWRQLEKERAYADNKYKNLPPAARAAADSDMDALERMWLAGDEEAGSFLKLLRGQSVSTGQRKKEYSSQISQMLSSYNPMYKNVGEMGQITQTQQAKPQVRIGGAVGQAYNKLKAMR